MNRYEIDSEKQTPLFKIADVVKEVDPTEHESDWGLFKVVDCKRSSRS